MYQPSPVQTFSEDGLVDISSQLLDSNGKLKLLSAAEYDEFKWQELRMFCHYYGRYLLPTVELVDYLRELISDRSVIEIGAGCGDLGYHLGISMTDNYVQTWPEVVAYYSAMKQPVISYGIDVEKIDAVDAVKKYRPDIAIGGWITNWVDPSKPPRPGSVYGVKEDAVLRSVKMYVMVGSEAIHQFKPLLNKKHRRVEASFVRSRSDRGDNVIWIWERI